MPWEYAPAPESRDIVSIKPRYGLFIDGREVQATGGGVFASVNPASEEVIAEVAKATPEDVDRAIRAARRAQRTRWGNLPGRERAKYLFRIARILQERSREFAVLESMDSGKPIKESRDVDVPLSAAHFWYYAGWADKLEYAFPGRVAKPLGVAAQVIPWNFPLLMLAWKIAPALAAGNTVVLKPASTTPLSALLFADVCRQADLPPGVVNIVPGPTT
ncbi:MAG: aldehyde dehydrogenase family protein, partial [Chloroflexi bacterium]|nr:aldehyde dehydrogenase family protein [Chloroflexota bacterium]